MDHLNYALFNYRGKYYLKLLRIGYDQAMDKRRRMAFGHDQYLQWCTT